MCNVPEILPANHPPTLFLHGGLDNVVPLWTALDYANELEKQGTPVPKVLEPLETHRWLAQSPGEIRAWFDLHRE